MARPSGGPFFLYVANLRPGRIEVYDTNFKPANFNGDNNNNKDGGDAFLDRTIPDGFGPFNVQDVNGNLYVTYAKQNATKHDDLDFPGEDPHEYCQTQALVTLCTSGRTIPRLILDSIDDPRTVSIPH